MRLGGVVLERLHQHELVRVVDAAGPFEPQVARFVRVALVKSSTRSSQPSACSGRTVNLTVMKIIASLPDLIVKYCVDCVPTLERPMRRALSGTFALRATGAEPKALVSSSTRSVPWCSSSSVSTIGLPLVLLAVQGLRDDVVGHVRADAEARETRDLQSSNGFPDPVDTVLDVCVRTAGQQRGASR